MENASKALLMAGGILIALMIIGALLLMFNQIGDYEKGQQSNEKTSSLAEFNSDFERYTDDNMINGVDIISLINKVIDYNKKESNGEITNAVNYDIKISLTISGLNKFNDTYAYNPGTTDQLFSQDEYTFGVGENNKNTNELKNTLDNCGFAEKSKASIAQLKELSGIYDKYNKQESINNIKTKLIEIDSETYEKWNATSNIEPTLDTIIKYRQYSEFKSSKFKSSKTEYKNGQITHMYFEFIK